MSSFNVIHLIKFNILVQFIALHCIALHCKVQSHSKMYVLGPDCIVYAPHFIACLNIKAGKALCKTDIRICLVFFRSLRQLGQTCPAVIQCWVSMRRTLTGGQAKQKQLNVWMKNSHLLLKQSCVRRPHRHTEMFCVVNVIRSHLNTAGGRSEL